MTEGVPLLLESIDKALQRLNRRVLLNSLQVGVPADVVRASLADVNLASTSALESLLDWKNGTSTAGVAAVDDIHMFPGFYLLSIEDAVASYRAFETDPRWAAAWLPLFANGGGDFYVIDLSVPEEAPVRHFRIDELEHPIEFASLEGLLGTLVAAFERGVIFVDPSGYLEMNDLAFGGLAAELNPTVEWWHD